MELNKTILYICFADDDKKYDLHTIKSKNIQCYTIYKIKIMISDWTYDKFCEIVSTFLISDLVRIVFDYSLDIQKSKFILGSYNGKPEVYFLTNATVYNFFVKNYPLDSIKIVLNYTSCTTTYKKIIKYKCSNSAVSCSCDSYLLPDGSKSGHITHVIRWWKDGTNCHTSSSLTEDEWYHVYLTCEIYKHFL